MEALHRADAEGRSRPGDLGELDAARHGGAQTWITGAYDPETNLYIFGTGNPTPAYTTGTRGDIDNLFTCSLIALNVDTGKMAWYFQTSPHDMHDYDSAQTPVLFDGMFNGKMRKMVVTAARNGYYFTLDRVTGEHLRHQQVWLDDELGQRPDSGWRTASAIQQRMRRSPARWFRRNQAEPSTGSRLRSLRHTGLLYTYETDTFSLVYLTDPDPRGSMGLGGKEEVGVGTAGSYLTAIDYKTGDARWRHRFYNNGTGRWRSSGDGRRSSFYRRWRRKPCGLRCRGWKAAVEHAHRACLQCATDL